MITPTELFMTSLFGTDEVRSSPPFGLQTLLPPEGFFSSNPALAAGELIEPPLRMLSAVLLELRDSHQSRWVLLEMGPGDLGAGRWTVPAERVVPGEMPLAVAMRAVTENICLLDDGLPVSWAGLQYRVLSVGLEWLTALSLADGSCLPACENLLVFTYHAQQDVIDLRRIELCDLKARNGRAMRHAGILDIQGAIDDATLCSVSEQLWRSYWQREAA